MDNIVEGRIRDRALQQARIDQEEGIRARRLNTFNNCLKLTAVIAFNAGILEISDGRVHERVLEQTKRREQAEEDAKDRRRKQHENEMNKVKGIREKTEALRSGIHKSCTQWSPGSSAQETATYQRGKSNC
jgi:hypothetical protein